MSTPKPPFRAEHVGSLPRPDPLMAAREDFAAKKIARAALTQIEDECIRVAVAMQERVGIGAITDGEFRKRGWREFLYDKCSGFGPETVERIPEDDHAELLGRSIPRLALAPFEASTPAKIRLAFIALVERAAHPISVAS